jgi:hypothetical protein
VATAIVSTGVGLVIAAASRHILAAYAGVIVPGSLWLSTLPPQPERDSRPRTLPALLTLPLARLYERMGEDREDWCDTRLEAASFKPQDIASAVNYYYNQVAGGLADSQARSQLDRWRESINHKISIVGLINRDVPEDGLLAKLHVHPDTEDERKYNYADRPGLASRLKAEARNELRLFLVLIYPLMGRKMLIYPFRPGAQRTYPPVLIK